MSKVWSLPVLAGCTGVLSLLIPMIGRRFAPVYAIISTGWTVLLLETLPFFGNRLSLISLLFAISIITDILVNGLNAFHFGDFILNAFMSAVAGFLIVKFGGAILNLIILIILFVLVILTNLKISLSLKKRKEKDYNPSDDSYVDDII
ncbi:MAG: hypothetical protein HFJ17_05755 [Clostridia bacterium]|nr:hypothetical protein [Clostridia bacterium]